MRTLQPEVIVIGAGIGGLCCALELALMGCRVTVLEKNSAPGGKMRQVRIGAAAIDAGPTVLTMPWVFEQLFARAGAKLSERVGLQPLSILARHAWDSPEHLDLYAKREASAEAIARFAGAREADGFLRFCAHAEKIYRILEQPFICQPCASAAALMQAVGVRAWPRLRAIAPFTSLHEALKGYFKDPRLLQLFGRYATYCGSSPYLAPATLMLVADVEQQGVWSIDGGMHALAAAVAALACENGVHVRYDSTVKEVTLKKGQTSGVVLSDGTHLAANAVVVNADVNAIASGLFGAAVRHAVTQRSLAQRSLSAVTWTLVAAAQGFPLLRHNVFFSKDYALEFDQLINQRRLPSEPTVYVCAQDRNDQAFTTEPPRPERFLCLVNAPAMGDQGTFTDEDMSACEQQMKERLKRCGLVLTWSEAETLRTTPTAFHQTYPATGGALYGQASHGWNASFQRPQARTRIPGLYLAGGSTHPGPGVPMAALSGHLAGLALAKDWGLTSRSATIATCGGTSMP